MTMNRADRNAIREATITLSELAARVEKLEAERDALARSNKWLRGRLNGFLRRAES